jgi:SAM-dependent methyltransferase
MRASPERETGGGETAAATPYVDPELYDLSYSWYDADIDFYVSAARQTGGPVLEACCGTGRILIPTAQAGVEIDGFDLEPQMLDRLRAKASALGLSPRVVTADMRTFTLGRRYDLVTIPFRAFLHNRTSPDQIATLRRCREHLSTAGRLIFNVFHPSFDSIVEHDGQKRVEREFDDPRTGVHVTLSTLTRYDRVHQLLLAEREVLESDPGGAALRHHRYDFTLRWVYKAEMELLLAAAGFARWEVRGDFDGRPLEKDTDEMVWTAWAS